MKYEEKIRRLLSGKGLLPDNLAGNDAGFIHNGKHFYVEVKNSKAPDFGQKRVRWSQDSGWYWAKEDIVTEIYDKYNILDEINPRFIPRRHSKPEAEITMEDKRYNQREFEQSGIVFESPDILYEYYARKGCEYIQIENKGFYCIAQDPANLGVPQFRPELQLRFRAKTHHSHPIYAYSFFVVIQKRGRVGKSNFDLENKIAPFPNITP